MGKPSLRARRLGKDHHPTGAPINVYEFSGRVHPPYIGRFAQASLTAVPGHIIDVMSERISNIWIMDLPK
jgi:hypothetical protein